jgi:hypothetical protein
MQIFWLLTILTSAAFAADPLILPAPELVRDIPWSVRTTAEWQGAIAAPTFPAATRDYHGKVIHKILTAHAASPTAQGRLLFSARSTVPEGAHRQLHFIFTDQRDVLLRDPSTGYQMGVVPYRGLPLSGYSLSRRNFYKQYNFIVVWVNNCLVNPGDYSPRENGFLPTWVNLAIQLNGYMNHHLSNPLPTFVADSQGVTMQGAHEKGLAAETEILAWLPTWEGLQTLTENERQWLANSNRLVRTTISITDGCPQDLQNRRQSTDN